MTASGPAAARRGGLPVGHLAELPQIEAGAVACLRLWGDGADAQARLRTALVGALGAEPARAALAAFERLAALLARYRRRPLMRHHRECACVGADEAVFAAMVSAAAGGEDEDAMLLAALLVAPAQLCELADLAGELGRALRRMSLCTTRPDGAASHPDVLH